MAMRRNLCNLIIVAAAMAFALVLGAGIQALFRLLLPTVSNRQLGGTDIGTYIGIPASGLAFLAYGYVVPRLMRAPSNLVWLLMPITVLYASALAQLPWLRSFDWPYLVVSIVVHSMFITSFISCAVGYVIHRNRTI